MSFTFFSLNTSAWKMDSKAAAEVLASSRVRRPDGLMKTSKQLRTRMIPLIAPTTFRRWMKSFAIADKSGSESFLAFLMGTIDHSGSAPSLNPGAV